MTTAIHTATLGISPFEQIQHVGSAFSNALSTLFESTSSAFCRVHIQKKDEQGNIRLYDKKETVVDPKTGISRLRSKRSAR